MSTSRAEELIRELVTISDIDIVRVSVSAFSMLRGLVNRLSDHDTLGTHAGCLETISMLGRRIEDLEKENRKLSKK